MARVQQTNPAEVPDLFRAQFELCKVQEGETIVVLSDVGTRPEYVQAAFAAANTFKANIYEMKVNSVQSWTSVGAETVGACKGGVEALKAADMVLAMHVPLFTKWMHEVRASGTRVLMIVDHPDDLKSQMSHPEIKRATKYITDRLSKAKTMRVTNEAGTDFVAEIGDYPSLCQWGFADEPGHFDHWGAGHCYTFPNEGKANGVVVAQPGDIVVLPYNRYVTDEIRMVIEDGYIQSIEGGLDARLMNHWLDSTKTSPDDREGRAISHIGFGTNPYCRWDCLALNGDDVDRSNGAVRGFAGNFLFSTGPNTQGGGTRVTKGHYDLPMKDCTAYLDDDMIIEAGTYIDPQMIADVEPRNQS